MRIDLHLSSDDPSFAPLREAWQGAARAHAGRHDALAQAAAEQYAMIASRPMPSVVREPLTLVPSVARLLSNPHFELEPEAREHFAGALAYFVDPDDLMPDNGGHFGYLDDALVLKLALAEARHEWFAWCDYSDYVAAHPDEAGIDRATWMQRRRDRLDLELRRRNHEGYAPDGRRPGRSFVDAYAPSTDAPLRFGIR
jgi:uncharacterized membrane protein YkvA (DUF1232 family)